jgi:putative hydrolase of the HAD superfamily
VFDDVRPTLQVLRERGFRLGILSNWDERLRPLLNELGLSTYFDVFAVSIEVGAPKPSLKIFDHAAAALGLPPQALLHVGDSRSEDVEGARAAGLASLLIDRDATAAVEVISSLREVPALLDKPL